MEYTVYWFRWFRLTDNTTGVRSAEFLNRSEFLKALARWNKQQPNTWKYVEAQVRPVDN